jgi:4-amino-4-deoxy-L-arabinose transferase-like glycosyltransferase
LHFAIAAVLLLASSLRFPDLQKVPLPLADEILAAVDVHYMIATGRHFDGAHAGILAYVIPTLDGRFLVSLLGGHTVPDFRLVSAFFGVLTVALMVWLGRELLDVRFGVLSAGALAVMPWHIYFSRIYFPGSEFLFLTLLAICSSLAALRRRSVALSMVAAISAAGSIYIYPVAIVSTPLLIGSVLAFRWRDFRSFGLLRTAAAVLVCGVLLVPYGLDHLIASDPSVGDANAVIRGKGIWNYYGLHIPQMAQHFVSSWASYTNPNFVLLHGDSNVAQSIQEMGQVGLALGIVGWIGILVAVYRRTPLHLLLIAMTVAYPIADALTYDNSSGNSLRGIVGSAVWALWFAVGVLEIQRFTRKSIRPVALTAVAAAVALQTVLFVGNYFGPYTVRYAYAFETGYDKIYANLAANGYQNVPITLHAGYARDAMLEYFSQYRLHATDISLACFDLPYFQLHYAALPRVIVVREDRGFAAVPYCVNQSKLIESDAAALLRAPLQPGEGARQLDIVAIFPNDPQGDYYTAIFYLHH